MRKLLVLIISCLCFTSIWANSAEGSAQNQDASNNNIENAAVTSFAELTVPL